MIIAQQTEQPVEKNSECRFIIISTGKITPACILMHKVCRVAKVFSASFYKTTFCLEGNVHSLEICPSWNISYMHTGNASVSYNE